MPQTLYVDWMNYPRNDKIPEIDDNESTHSNETMTTTVTQDIKKKILVSDGFIDSKMNLEILEQAAPRNLFQLLSWLKPAFNKLHTLHNQSLKPKTDFSPRKIDYQKAFRYHNYNHNTQFEFLFYFFVCLYVKFHISVSIKKKAKKK